MRVLQFRHDCQNLGCANLSCNLCKLSQRRRCDTNFAPKYLAPCDVIEAKCGAQIYTVVVETTTGELVSAGLDDAFLQISIIDGRRFEGEGERDEALEDCQLLLNKQGQPLLAHGRSGAYTEDKRVLVPMIHGQAMLPDLKVTDSSEALLQGRAPPFRLLVRAVRRGGQIVTDIRYALSEPFVVATARVKGAAKLEIPHVDDHVSKIECVGVQTQKKLEDIRAASAAAGVPDLRIPINSVTKVGQFRDLVEMAERNKPLRETLKQVLRLTKGWDVARDHVRRAVETDVQLRVFHPDGRTDVGLVFKCGAFNVIEMHRPVGLMRRKTNPQQPNQELVDVIWLPLDPSAHPEAVKKLLPQASSAWWTAGHPGWQFLPLTTAHLPAYPEGGQPATLTSSFTFTVRPAMPPPAAGLAPAGLAGLALPGGVPQGLAAGLGAPAMPAASGTFGSGPLGNAPLGSASLAGLPGMPMPGAGLPPGLLGGVPLGPADALLLQQQQQQLAAGSGTAPGLAPGLFPASSAGAPLPAMMFGSGGVPPMPPSPMHGISASGTGTQQPAQTTTSTVGDMAMGGLTLMEDDSLSPFEDPTFQQLMSAVAANAPDKPQAQAQPGDEQREQAEGNAGNHAGGGQPGGRGSAPGSGDSGGQVKRKADTSLETWIAAHKSLDFPDFPSLPPNLAQLSSLFTSLLTGNEMSPGGAMQLGEGVPQGLPQGLQQATGQRKHELKQQRREAPAAGGVVPVSAPLHAAPTGLGAAAAAAAPASVPQPQQLQQQQQQQQLAPQRHLQTAAGAQQEQQPAQPPAIAAPPKPTAVPPPPATAAAPPMPAVSPPPAPAPAAPSANSAAAGPAVPVAQQPAMVSGVTMEQMQQMFQRAVRQEISYDQLEAFLKQHNLLPTGQPATAAGVLAPPAAGAFAPAATALPTLSPAGQVASVSAPPSAATAAAAGAGPGGASPAATPLVKAEGEAAGHQAGLAAGAVPPLGGAADMSFGLDDMKSIEVGLPPYR